MVGLWVYFVFFSFGAEEGTWTPTPVKGLDSESSASTNFTTSAYFWILALGQKVSILDKKFKYFLAFALEFKISPVLSFLNKISTVSIFRSCFSCSINSKRLMLFPFAKLKISPFRFGWLAKNKFALATFDTLIKSLVCLPDP